MPKRDEHRSYAAMAGRYALMTAAAATLSLSVVASTAKAEDVCVVKSTDLDFDMLEPLQNAANAKPGPRVVPPRIIPLPTTTSPKFQAIVAAPYRVPAWNANPKSAAEWKELVAKLAAAGAALQPALREKLGVTMEPTVIAGVKAFILTPKVIPPANQNRLLYHIHGGGYVYAPGEAGTAEATLMAAFGGFKVISVDYRMPPDFPYPAAMDDAMAVWKEVVKLQNPRNIAVFRDVDRRRHDARARSARQAGRIAASGRDRARHALIGSDRGGRQLQNQRVGRQRSGQLQRLYQSLGAALCQWA
jgi:epsilon-lactone hydrolase